MRKEFQQKLATKINSSKTGDPLKINFLYLAILSWLRPCLSHKRKKISIGIMENQLLLLLGVGGCGGKVEAWGTLPPPPPPRNDAPDQIGESLRSSESRDLSSINPLPLPSDRQRPHGSNRYYCYINKWVCIPLTTN